LGMPNIGIVMAINRASAGRGSSIYEPEERARPVGELIARFCSTDSCCRRRKCDGPFSS